MEVGLCTTPDPGLILQVYSPGNDAAEERDIKQEVLRQSVEAAHGSEVHQAVGGLLAVLNRNTSCRSRWKRGGLSDRHSHTFSDVSGSAGDTVLYLQR